MDIRQLTYFVAAVEEKTITAAAEKLHMTQPPLTMQLHMLEDELGCKLFRRDGRTLSLTDAGQHFYSRALEIIGMCDSAKSEMNDYRSGNAGELRIGAISSVRGTLFTDWIKDYHDKYPYVKISVHSANTYQLLEQLRNREIDMAVIRTPFPAGYFETEYIRREEMSAIGNGKFFSCPDSDDISLQELSASPLIVYRRWQKIIESVFETSGLVPKICCVNDDAEMTLSLALSGIGVGLLHTSALPGKCDESIRILKLHEKTLSSEIALVCQSKKSLPEPSALFCKLVSENK